MAKAIPSTPDNDRLMLYMISEGMIKKGLITTIPNYTQTLGRIVLTNNGRVAIQGSNRYQPFEIGNKPVTDYSVLELVGLMEGGWLSGPTRYADGTIRGVAKLRHEPAEVIRYYLDYEVVHDPQLGVYHLQPVPGA
jgi:hypothetical protein